MHQQLPASSYAGLPHAPTIQQVNNLGPVNPEPQSPINPALMAQPNQQQQQVQVSVWVFLAGGGAISTLTAIILVNSLFGMELFGNSPFGRNFSVASTIS